MEPLSYLERNLAGMFLIWLSTKCTLCRLEILNGYMNDHWMVRYHGYKNLQFFTWISKMTIITGQWFSLENVFKIYFSETAETSMKVQFLGWSFRKCTKNSSWSWIHGQWNSVYTKYQRCPECRIYLQRWRVLLNCN